jgi:hypothetical protein
MQAAATQRQRQRLLLERRALAGTATTGGVVAGGAGSAPHQDLSSSLVSKTAAGEQGGGPVDDAVLTAQFALGWSGYSGSSSCRQHTDMTTEDSKKFIALTKTTLTTAQIANLFG